MISHQHSPSLFVVATYSLLTCGVFASETADPPEDAAYRMPTVYVSASRLPPAGAQMDKAVDAVRNVIVLDSAEIARRAPESISDLLSSLPGVDTRTRGPFGVQTDLEVNGATFSQVLVLVDGMRVNDPQTGHHTLNLPLAPQDLERVEITYGAGSAIHGPDAFGAVVNLVPKRNASNRLDISGNLGDTLGPTEASGLGGDASLNYGVNGEWGSVWAAVGKSHSDGYRDDTDFDTDRAMVSARLPVAGGDLSLLWGVQDRAFGANDFYGPFTSKEWTRAWLYSARFRTTYLQKRSLEGGIYYRRHRDRFVLIEASPEVYQNIHNNELATAQLHGTVASGSWGALLVGGEIARETIDSNNLGDRDKSRGSMFGEYSGALGERLQVSAGARLDRHEDFGWEPSPSLALSFRHTAKTRYFASAGRSYRAPSFTELCYEDTFNVGNPDLSAESAWSLEGGTQIAATKAVNLTASGFVRFENNLVDYIRAVDTPPWVAQNLGEMRTTGLQLSAAGSWPLLRAQMDYTLVDKEKTLGSGLQSKYVFTHPRHQLAVRVDHQLRAGFDAGWRLTLKERQLEEDYTLVDFVMSRHFSFGRSLLRIRNLTNQRYESVLGVPMPGRWFTLETQINL